MRHSEHSPDAGAVSCKQDTAKLNFKYDLRTRYIVTEMCPDQYGRWTSRSHTSKSPSQLQPAHYQLIVGDKGDPADDQHIRKLTIVDLELVTPAGHGHRVETRNDPFSGGEAAFHPHNQVLYGIRANR